MKSLAYECYETGQIAEVELDYRIAQFMTVKKYDVLYAEELPRFQKNPADIYALPLLDTPKKVYLGAGRLGMLVGRDQLRENLTETQRALARKMDEDFCCELTFSEEHSALEYMNLFCDADQYELIYVRNSGEHSAIPEGYRFSGYDVCYPPEYDGGFSIICDCMFLCCWHGCDEEGTLFAEDFAKLNDSGLFDTWQDAHDYMVRYLSADWTERGVYFITEIYRKRS